MSEDQFMKLYRLVQEDLKATNSKIDTLQEHIDQRFDQVYELFDGVSHVVTEGEAERAALHSSDNRQTDWIKQLASATDTKLAPEA